MVTYYSISKSSFNVLYLELLFSFTQGFLFLCVTPSYVFPLILEIMCGIQDVKRRKYVNLEIVGRAAYEYT